MKECILSYLRGDLWQRTRKTPLGLFDRQLSLLAETGQVIAVVFSSSFDHLCVGPIQEKQQQNTEIIRAQYPIILFSCCIHWICCCGLFSLMDQLKLCKADYHTADLHFTQMY